MEIYLYRHEGAILVYDLSGPVFIAEFYRIIIKVQSYLRTPFSFFAPCHGKLGTAFGLPVNGDRSILVGKSIYRYPVSHHECRIESKTEMPYYLVLIGLVLILPEEIGSTGKCHLIDIALHLFFCHAEAIVRKSDCLFIRIHRYIDPVLFSLGSLILSDKAQFFKLGDRIASV